MRSPNEILNEARRRLNVINARINNHALNRSPIKEARAVVAQYPGADKEVVESELARRRLPGLAAQGKAMFFGLASLARLNRQRLKLETKIAKLEAARGH